MSRRMRAELATFCGELMLSAVCALIGCGGRNEPEETLEVEIGIPDKETRRMFLPLEAGGDIFYFKGLQVEDFVMLAIRVKQTEPEAFVEVSVEDVETGTIAQRPAWTAPEPLECTSDGWCVLAPVLLPARELGELSDIKDAHLKVHCKVWLENGARGEAGAEGILRPQP